MNQFKDVWVNDTRYINTTNTDWWCKHNYGYQTLFISNNNKVGKVKLKKVENRKCVLNPNRIKDKQLFLKAKLNVDDNLLLINLIPSIF